MKRTLNHNAREFFPSNGGSTRSKWGSSFLPSQEATDVVNKVPEKVFPPFSNDGAEVRHFLPATRSLLQCRAAFYEQFRCSGCRQLEFEHLLRHCFFVMHETNELIVSSTSVCGRYGPFWLSYPPVYFLMAHDVVQEIEFGTPYPVEDTALNANNENNSQEREQLREAYLVNVVPVTPCTLRRQLACCARRVSAASSDEVKNAVLYTLNIFFFFMRLQFLQFLDGPTGSSYSACVQTLTQLREHLLRSELANSFLSVAVVLILLSTIHLASAQHAVETATCDAISMTLKVQHLLCACFPALVVAFLAGSPLQSLEELRRSFITTKLDGCLAGLETCPRGVAAVRELISYNMKTAILWSVTMNEVAIFSLRHIKARGDCIASGGISWGAKGWLAFDNQLQVRHGTTLGYLLDVTDHVLQKDFKKLLQHSLESSSSEEFHQIALEVASVSSGDEYETIFFSLLALSHMECFGATELSHLFAALERACGVKSSLCAFHAFISSTASASLGRSARELLDVLAVLIRCGVSMHMRAVVEVKDIVVRRHASLLPQGPPALPSPSQ